MSPKVVAIIPARKGSKRLPAKNKRLFAGKPLICWSIDVALECDFIDEIIVSTDDLDILKMCLMYKHKTNRIKLIKRPDELTQDDTPMWQVIDHVLDDYPHNILVILLQPTSPLRTKFDISRAYKLFYDRDYNWSVASASYIKGEKEIKLNGAIYIADLEHIRVYESFIGASVVYIYLMPKESSIDIDTLEDFYKAEKIMKKRLEVEKNE
jgi:CMP-N-acetylneuraminic acid synthetase